MEPNAPAAPANEPAAPVSNEPAAPAAPANEPAAPATPAPAGDNNQPAAPAKGNNLDTIDIDNILTEAEKQANAAGGGQTPPADPAAPPADPNAPATPPAGNEPPAADPNAPAQPDPNKPAEPAASTDLPAWNTITPQSTDLAAVEADDKYGIQPISEFPEPAEGQSWNDYVKAELMPRMVQAVTNLAGLRQKSFDNAATQQTQAEQQAQQERADGWVATIDDMVKSKAIPGYTLDKDGKLDMNSEGGKVVAAVFQKMNELNKDRPEGQKIYDFGVVHKLWKADEAERAASEAAQRGANTRREQSRRIAGSTQNNSSKPQAGAGIRKGMTLDDIEIE